MGYVEGAGTGKERGLKEGFVEGFVSGMNVSVPSAILCGKIK